MEKTPKDQSTISFCKCLVRCSQYCPELVKNETRHVSFSDLQNTENMEIDKLVYQSQEKCIFIRRSLMYSDSSE